MHEPGEDAAPAPPGGRGRHTGDDLGGPLAASPRCCLGGALSVTCTEAFCGVLAFERAHNTKEPYCLHKKPECCQGKDVSRDLL